MRFIFELPSEIERPNNKCPIKKSRMLICINVELVSNFLSPSSRVGVMKGEECRTANCCWPSPAQLILFSGPVGTHDQFLFAPRPLNRALLLAKGYDEFCVRDTHKAVVPDGMGNCRLYVND
jgi:hypothetical protein